MSSDQSTNAANPVNSTSTILPPPANSSPIPASVNNVSGNNSSSSSSTTAPAATTTTAVTSNTAAPQDTSANFPATNINYTPPLAQTVPDVSREEILRQIFGDIGTLIDDFTCAVESTVLLHGRIYITSKFICFYSNLFGLEKKIRIPYSHIKSITRENTAIVIPNAIAISTDKKDYIFRSFWDRDECFRILCAFLEKYRLTHQPKNQHVDSIQPFSNSILNPLSPSNSVNNIPPPSGPTPAVILSPSSTSTSTNATTSNSNAPIITATVISSSGTTSTTAAATTTTTTTTTTATASTPANIAPAETSLLDEKKSIQSRRLSSWTLDSEEVVDTESGIRPERPSSMTVDPSQQFQQELVKSKLKLPVLNDFIEISLQDFESLFIAENAPYSYKRYHESVKDTEVVATPWSSYTAGTVVCNREIKFFKPVNLPGLASTRGVKIQQLKKFESHGLILSSSTRLEDVPAADSFSVDDVLAVNVVSENKINLDISFQVTFLKSTYMKYFIERSTNVEMTKWLEQLFQHFKHISGLYREGKISLTDAPIDESSGKESSSPAEDDGEGEGTDGKDDNVPGDETDHHHHQHHQQQHQHDHGHPHHPKTLNPIISFLVEFTNASFIDRMKTTIIILLVFFLIANAMSWKIANSRLVDLENKLKSMEENMQHTHQIYQILQQVQHQVDLQQLAQFRAITAEKTSM